MAQCQRTGDHARDQQDEDDRAEAVRVHRMHAEQQVHVRQDAERGHGQHGEQGRVDGAFRGRRVERADEVSRTGGEHAHRQAGQCVPHGAGHQATVAILPSRGNPSSAVPATSGADGESDRTT